MTVKTAKLLGKDPSMGSGAKRCGMLVALMLISIQPQVPAATSPSFSRIEWLQAGWRAERMSEADGDFSDPSTQDIIENVPWMKAALENVVELSPEIRISPDGYAYFFESSQRTGLERGTSVFRVFPGKGNPERFATGLREPLPIVFDAFGQPFVLDAGLRDSGNSRWLSLIEGADYGWRNVSDVGVEGRRDLLVDRHTLPTNSMSLLGNVMAPVAVLLQHPVSVIAQTDSGWSVDSPQVFIVVGKKDGDYEVGSYFSHPAGTGFDLVFRTTLARSGLPMLLTRGAESGLILAQTPLNGARPASFRFFDPKLEFSPESVRIKQLLGADPLSQSTAFLIQCLDHKDRRIRMKAQFELAARGEVALDELFRRVKNPFLTIGRLHALWSIRLIISQQPEQRLKLSNEGWETSLLADPEPRVRSTALEIYAMTGGLNRERLVGEALRDADPGVRLLAVKLLGALDLKGYKQSLLDWMVRAENQQHAQQQAARIALSNLMSAEEFMELVTHPEDKIRMAALLGLRRKRHVGIQEFLHDANPFITVEAACAILEESVREAFPALASMHATRSDWSPAFASVDQHLPDWSILESMLLHVYAANAMLQEPVHIRALAEAVESRKYESNIRARCSERLLNWLGDKTENSDRWDEAFDDIWKERADAWVKADLEGQRRFMLEYIRIREWKHHARLLENIFRGFTESHQNRAKALWTLADWRVPQLQSLIREALISNSALLRKEAVLIQSGLNPDDQVAGWVGQLESGELGLWQAALKQLGSSRDRRVDSVLLYWLDEALNGNLSLEWHRDLMEAAQQRTPPVIRQKLADLKAKHGQ
jgi:quinoprotein glucose dehydrogenase